MSKKENSKKMGNRMKVTIVNIAVFIVLVGGFFYLVRNYFHIGKDNFTNSAQVEGFVTLSAACTQHLHWHRYQAIM